jgi:hypothetical protein
MILYCGCEKEYIRLHFEGTFRVIDSSYRWQMNQSPINSVYEFDGSVELSPREYQKNAPTGFKSIDIKLNSNVYHVFVDKNGNFKFPASPLIMSGSYSDDDHFTLNVRESTLSHEYDYRYSGTRK